MVSEAHAFFDEMGAGFLLTCLVVVTLFAGVCDGSLGRGDWWRHASVHSVHTLVCESRCPWTSIGHAGHMAWWPYFLQLKHCSGRFTKGLIQKLPYPW